MPLILPTQPQDGQDRLQIVQANQYQFEYQSLGDDHPVIMPIVPENLWLIPK